MGLISPIIRLISPIHDLCESPVSFGCKLFLLLFLRGWFTEIRFQLLDGVVNDDEAHQQEYQYETHLLEPFAEVHGQSQPDQPKNPFDEDQQDHAAIEHRNRQQVQYPQTQAEQSHQLDDPGPSVYLIGVDGYTRDPDRSGDGVPRRTLTAENLLEDFAREFQDANVVVPAVADRSRNRIRLQQLGLEHTVEAQQVRVVLLFRLAVNRQSFLPPVNGQRDRTAFLNHAAELMPAGDRRAIDRGDLIAGLQTGAISRRVLHDLRHANV